MGNDSRNDYELPCYMDVGNRLFPEAPQGQNLDLTDPNTRDQMLKKHVIRETQRKGMKPVQFWALSHRDIAANNPTHGPTGTDVRGEGDQRSGLWGNGVYRRGDSPTTDQGAMANRLGPTDPGSSNSNFYHEALDKIFAGPFTIVGEYLPTPPSHVLSDFGIERPANDVIYFLRDDVMLNLGREPQVGDLWERFDGLLMEILTSTPHQAENFEWLYIACNCMNTQKTRSMMFRD